MHDAHVTLVGNVVSDVRVTRLDSGLTVAAFRLAVTPRRYQADTGRWVDLTSTYITVDCWRSLGENVAASVHKGDPVLVIGRLRMREYTQGDQRRQEIQLDARWVGHDLARGRTRFARTPRGEQLVSPDGLGRPRPRDWSPVPPRGRRPRWSSVPGPGRSRTVTRPDARPPTSPGRPTGAVAWQGAPPRGPAAARRPAGRCARPAGPSDAAPPRPAHGRRLVLPGRLRPDARSRRRHDGRATAPAHGPADGHLAAQRRGAPPGQPGQRPRGPPGGAEPHDRGEGHLPLGGLPRRPAAPGRPAVGRAARGVRRRRGAYRPSRRPPGAGRARSVGHRHPRARRRRGEPGPRPHPAGRRADRTRRGRRGGPARARGSSTACCPWTRGSRSAVPGCRWAAWPTCRLGPGASGWQGSPGRGSCSSAASRSRSCW